MTEQPKGTFTCPRCDVPVDRGMRRCFDNLYNCVGCHAWIQEGPGFHGVAEARVLDVPQGMMITPTGVWAGAPIFKFMNHLLDEIPMGMVENVIQRIIKGPDRIRVEPDSRANYVIHVLARLGIKVL